MVTSTGMRLLTCPQINTEPSLKIPKYSSGVLSACKVKERAFSLAKHSRVETMIGGYSRHVRRQLAATVHRPQGPEKNSMTNCFSSIAEWIYQA